MAEAVFSLTENSIMIIQTNNTPERDRKKAFEKYAERTSKDEVVIPPLLLPDHERRHYVRETLREDHKYRIKNNPEGAQAKFDKLASSCFKFFRGTALLFYRDYAGTDYHLPFVFTIVDVHPENFGVMPNENGAPFFGINDFDEAHIAPFSYDIKRGAVGFYLAAKEEGELKRKKREKVVKAFVKGYIEGLKEFAKDDREKWLEYRIDNSPKLIKDLLEKAKSSRKDFLKDLVNVKKEKFIPNEKINPFSKHIEKFQKIVNKYQKENEINVSGLNQEFFKVKDVAIKTDSGTASLGS